MALEFAEHESIWDCRVVCLKCSEAIEVSVFVFHSSAAIVKQSVNELLVDFGWLPTSSGGYCRQHSSFAKGAKAG